MVTETTTDKTELLDAIGEAVSQLTRLLSSLDDDNLNVVPYEGSWTAPQLLRHITMSINGMTKAMGSKAAPADRAPVERAPELKKIFLDFTKKMRSPEFIVPEDGPYEKGESIKSLKHSFEKLKDAAAKENMSDLVKGLPFGDVTKLEILHFVLYHTDRHLHQMRKICIALEKM